MSDQPKKRGRPSGSKNKTKGFRVGKPRTFRKSNIIDFSDDFFDLNPKPLILDEPEVDWKLLSERLQEALSTQIRENQELEKKLALAESNNSNLSAIINYLEFKLGYHSVRGN